MNSEQNFFFRFTRVAVEGPTYLNLVYLILMLPLGIIYFTLIITFLSISISFTFSPIMWILQEEADLYFGNNCIWYPDFDETILLSLAGIVLFFFTLHLGKFLADVEEFLCKNSLMQK